MLFSTIEYEKWKNVKTNIAEISEEDLIFFLSLLYGIQHQLSNLSWISTLLLNVQIPSAPSEYLEDCDF